MPTSSTGTNNAFTLVELIVVIAVISVLATMAIPPLASAAGERQLRVSARRLLVTARYARDFAATHRRMCRLLIDQRQGRYALFQQADPRQGGDEYHPLHAGIGGPERLAHPLRFAKVLIEPRSLREASRPPGDCITFDAFGQADPAVVAITDGRRSYSILIEPATGRARLAEGIAEKTPDDRVDLDG
ncbi:MAG: prepilin-type N-terminal cleavage/methylation domain-containing protein [Planctomycetes bacterium]|nr:prepilin-type N-terminal cleavage/methylation domain-containing protein [Planctomycetota bacterium]